MNWLLTRLEKLRHSTNPLIQKLLGWSSAEDLQDRQDFASDAEWAILTQDPRRPRLFIWTIGLFIVTALIWSSLATLDEVARGDGKAGSLPQRGSHDLRYRRVRRAVDRRATGARSKRAD